MVVAPPRQVATVLGILGVGFAKEDCAEGRVSNRAVEPKVGPAVAALGCLGRAAIGVVELGYCNHHVPLSGRPLIAVYCRIGTVRCHAWPSKLPTISTSTTL